jgi:hypothetical protein
MISVTIFVVGASLTSLRPTPQTSSTWRIGGPPIIVTLAQYSRE